MHPRTRDGLLDWVRYWSARAELPITCLLARLDVPASRYYDWRERYGRLNAHNAPVPRWFWLLPAEKQAILDCQRQRPDEGYRRLCSRMYSSA